MPIKVVLTMILILPFCAELMWVILKCVRFNLRDIANAVFVTVVNITLRVIDTNYFDPCLSTYVKN